MKKKSFVCQAVELWEDTINTFPNIVLCFLVFKLNIFGTVNLVWLLVGLKILLVYNIFNDS